MKTNLNATVHDHRASIYVSLVFLFLALSLQTLVWAYWNKILEPRLKSEAKSQANVLAHSQAIRLADAILIEAEQRLQSLREAIDELLLFTGSASDEPLFLGLDLEIDYDVVTVQHGSLDFQYDDKPCQSCFPCEVGIYSPVSDELMGIARFRVSDRLYRNLSRDVRKTLFIQSHLGTLLLLVVWGVVMVLIQKINSSRRQAEIANRAKSAFLANMSHELRTPLNAIIGFSEMMGRDSKIEKKDRENIAIIHRSGEYLLELINDVLELSKIEAARSTLSIDTFDLHDTLEKVTEMIRLRAEKKHLRLQVERSEDIPRFIQSDERKLRQILLNLMGNAIKFTPKGLVTLRVWCDRDGDEKRDDDFLPLHFAVEDSGPGIASEDAESIFEAFTQTKSGVEKLEGSGLGLTISRQFAHSLGGDIRVECIEGKGAVFEVTVLVRPATASIVEAHPQQQRVIAMKTVRETDTLQWPLRILVADDHAENRDLLRLILERVGFDVKTAENGHRAVDLYEKWRPQLIWMDIRMPIMDGYEATKTIHRVAKEKQATPPVIIALTASAFNEDRNAVLAAGCDDFVRRPFRESEIFTKLQEHLGVEYTYEPYETNSSEKSSSFGLSPEAFQAAITRLPRSIAIELKTAIELSDMDRMAKVVGEIGIDHRGLARELKELVDTFQFDRLLALLGGTKDE